MITEKEAKQAANYIVDFALSDQPEARIPTSDYSHACKLARKAAKQAGTAYVIVCSGMDEVAQWRFDSCCGGRFIQRSFEV